MIVQTVGVGDVLATRSKSRFGRLIRIGAALASSYADVNHVAVLHHHDKAGTWWALEGRPGGLGWVDARGYLASPWTVSNADQPRTAEQRQQIAAAAESLLGTGYDWLQGIFPDAALSLVPQLDKLWHEDWHRQGPPAHVVCSSAAAWVHYHLGLARPTVHDGPRTTPGDWGVFITERQWEAV